MDIRVHLERLHPPCGWLTRDQGAGAPGSNITRRIEFTGWLGLLRALEELLAMSRGEREPD